MTKRNERNLTWHAGRIQAPDREHLLGQRGCVLWFTGLSGSGKSTVARALEEALHGAGRLCYVLDGDNVRHGLNGDLGFSPEDRRENIRRVGHVAALFADAGVITLTAFISPYRADREAVGELLPEGRFLEIHLSADVETCEGRDPKGLYRKARAGEIAEFTGVSAPYETSSRPALRLDTGRMTVDECVERIVSMLEARGIIGGGTVDDAGSEEKA